MNCRPPRLLFFFFFNDPATTEIYPLPLHDALPIPRRHEGHDPGDVPHRRRRVRQEEAPVRVDRKSTRLNSSHSQISYAVFCLKKKKNEMQTTAPQRAARVTTTARCTSTWRSERAAG